ncbi:MAG: TIM barrel protein [FCB group bacterium]|jgi:sugar phosphate isomerase/epimerase|nr:TIM barrel protein [FCB group bacterium]
MAESLHDFMKVGIIHFMAFPQCGGGDGPIAETFRTLALDPFFDVIEVTQVKDPAARKQVRAIAEQARVDIPFGAQPILLGGKLDLNSPDVAARQKAIDAIKAAIDEAAELESDALAVLSGPVTEDRGAAMGRLVDSLKQLCAYGKPKGIRIVLETFDQVPYGKNCLIGPTEDAVKVSEAVREEYPDFGLLLDLSHLPLLAESSKHAIKAAGKHLVHVHIGNCAMDDASHPAYGDNHPRFGAPGTRNDVPELVQFLMVLLDSGFLRRDERRIVSFEVKPMAGEDAEAVVAGSKRTLIEAWRRLEQEGHLAAILAAAMTV